MNAVTPPIDQCKSVFESWLADRAGQEPAWLGGQRKQAMEDFMRLGLPTLQDEAWRYTRLAAFDAERLRPTWSSDVIPDQVAVQGVAAGVSVVFVDGVFDRRLSNIDDLPPGVSLSSWALSPGLIRQDNLGPAVDGLRALNRALMRDGVHICIAPEVTLVQPIELIHLATGKGAHYLHHHIELGQGAQASILERYAGQGDGEYFTSCTTQLTVARDAHLSHVKIQDERPRALHYAVMRVEQQQCSQFDSFVLSLGAQLSRHEMEQRFAGQGGSCRLDGLFLINGRQHADLQTRIDHAMPRCVSRAFYRGIADQRARGVFNGQIIVRQGAQQSDARLVTNNLLLSPQAEIDCKPQLEIYADDVKCGHGATIGQLDEDALFYLRSRGLDLPAARNLLVYAFANEVLGRIADQQIRQYCLQRVLEKLSQGLDIKELTWHEG